MADAPGTAIAEAVLNVVRFRLQAEESKLSTAQGATTPLGVLTQLLLSVTMVTVAAHKLRQVRVDPVSCTETETATAW